MLNFLMPNAKCYYAIAECNDAECYHAYCHDAECSSPIQCHNHKDFGQL
jgi:hypothetical protein